jgi:geranylgeranyl reductase family protein
MISIIGAGPVGCFLAQKLAAAGLKVELFEEHEKTGLPIQCTGLLTPEIQKILPLNKAFIVNTFDAVEVFAPDNSSAKVPVKEFLVDRYKFDNYLLKKAIATGVKINYSHRFKSYQDKQAVFQTKTGTKRVKTDILIGADGPLSQVAKTAGLYNKREFFIGIQATIQGKFNPKTYQTYFGNMAPGFFAWIVPESDTTARVGLATRKNARLHFENFIKGKGKVIAMQSGIIPIYDKKQKVQKHNVYLVGDAATLCKATTGGGLVPGLKSANILADCIINKKKYNTAIKKVRRQLAMHNLIRSTLDRFSTKDYNKLVASLQNPKVASTLKNNNRDSALTLIPKLLLAEPKLLYFSKCLFQKKKVF